jgi:hypothetical protein
VVSLDTATLGRGGPAPGDTDGDRFATVGDDETPLLAGLGFDRLAGDVGDDGPLPGQLAGMVGQRHRVSRSTRMSTTPDFPGVPR